MTDKSLIKTEFCLKDKISECTTRKNNEIFTLLSDSKGKYLERAAHNLGSIIPNKTRWWCKSGARCRETLEWTKQKFEGSEISGRNHTVFIWLGTCDLTSKSKNGEIRIKDETNETANQVIDTYKRLGQFLKSKKCRVIILELPYYSIKIWNTHKTKETTDSYIEEDKKLKAQVDYINEHIQIINSENGIQAPQFNKDLLKHRSGGKDKKTCRYINWAHLPDGIHPAPLISRIWLLKTVLCYLKI